MNRLYAILLALLVITTTAQAEKRKSPNTTPQLTYMEPDALMHALVPEKAMSHPQDVVVVRRRQHTMGKRGIDVSHYQNRINWDQVADDPNVSYVYIKATENAGLVDNMFQTNLREAHRAGIPVGCYHFFSPTAAPTAQLKNLTSVVPNLRDHDLVPMIDVEVRGKASPADMRARLKQFLRSVEDYYGVRPIIYTGQNFYNKYLSGYFDEYLFMIAKYSEGVPELVGNPKFAMWQFSASGRVKGIRGAVDQSCFMDNYSLRDILIKKR